MFRCWLADRICPVSKHKILEPVISDRNPHQKRQSKKNQKQKQNPTTEYLVIHANEKFVGGMASRKYLCQHL